MIVMKFGGTSVGDAAAINRVVGIVQGRVSLQPVVVVSAMTKMTDQLLAMGQAAGRGDRDTALDLCRSARTRHRDTASAVLDSQTGPVHLEMEALFDALEELLRGIAAVGELTPRTTDHVLSFGERLSSRLVTEALRVRGLPSVLVDARELIVTNGDHTRAAPQMEETDDRLQTLLKPLLEQGQLPVMAGFLGATREGVTTTIGRGGSDYSASIVGAGLDAGRIEIWTDVDGMRTTDPNLCPEAHRIREISYQEAAELAYFGAKVLHPATVLPAIRKNIPVLVLNSRNPGNEGTRITAAGTRSTNVFKAIAVKKRITIVDVVAARMLMAHGFLKRIFDVFEKHHCSVDVVSTSEVSVSLTVDSNEALPAIAADLRDLADVKYEGRKAIVCLVGENLRQTAGIAAQVFSAIAGINVRMISQGASEINITFVIEEEDVPEAVRQLHAAFFAEVDPAVFE